MSEQKNEALEGELVVIAKENGLAPTKIEGLIARFGESFIHAKQAIGMSKDIVVVSENQVDEMEQARVARLELKDIRVTVEKTRKELKEQSLREGKAIDGMANIIKAMIVPVEEDLEKSENFAKRLAEERKQLMIASRGAILQKYVDRPDLYKFEDLSDEDFEKLVADLKRQKQEDEDAARVAEEKRKAAETAERKRRAEIEAENARLKADAEQREKDTAIERDKIQAENDKRLAVERAKADEERKKRKTLEAEKRAKDAAEAKAKAEAEAAERRALLAPDKEKLTALARAIADDNKEMPAIQSDKALQVINHVRATIADLVDYINQKAEEL